MPSDAMREGRDLFYNWKSRGKAKSLSSPHLQIALLLCNSTDPTTTGGHVGEGLDGLRRGHMS